MDGKSVAAAVLKYVDVKGLVVDGVMRGVVKAKLEDLVKNSSNSFDDAAFAFLWPQLEGAVITWVDAELAKLK